MIRCLIIDDEPLARQLLESYIDQLPELTCIAACESAVAAFTVLHEQEIDVMFLDIQMPKITGLSFLRSLRNPPEVVFTTAYSDHAVEAFELEAIDYLLKPITFERFLKTVQKLTFKKNILPEPEVRQGIENAPVFLKVNRRLVKVNSEEIMYIEGLGDYVKVHTTSETHVTHSTLNKLETLLSPVNFVRIHRSTIINLNFLQFQEGNYVRLNQ